MKEEYINQLLEEPEYLFYGSNKKLEKIKVENNEQGFILPDIVKASAYAFKEGIKNNSVGLYYKIIIDNDNYPAMILENVNTENVRGYIYVFKNSDQFTKDKYSNKYRCTLEQTPYEILEVSFEDFKKYFEIR